MNALRAFEAVVRHGRFVAAADELCVTHSAVSRFVKILEEDLGRPLLVRSPRGVVPTPDGAVLARAVESALDLIEATTSRMRGAHGRDLRVSCLGTFLLRRLIPALPGFAAAHPEIGLALSQSDEPADFSHGGYDIAIRVGGGPVPGEGGRRPFAQESIGPVMTPMVAVRIDAADPSSLANVTRLHTATRRHAWTQWATMAGVEIADRDDGPVFDHFYFMIEAVLSGLGAAVVPSILVADDIAKGSLVAPFGFRASGQTYAVHIGRNALPSAGLFADWLTGAIRG